MSGPAYSGKDVAWLIPTKDRPQHLGSLLESLARQTVECGRAIVVASGQNVEEVVRAYRERLPVEYFHCPVPGQIRQRNLGLEKLGGSTALVGFLDDDLVLEPDALEKMIELWNRAEPETAGIGFNIVNAPPSSASPLLRSLLRAATPGRVLRSGYNSRIDGIERDIRTEWLGGGYTVWRRDILERFRQPELKTRWAIGEDVRFSYPVGKLHPLYVCAAARVRHAITFDQLPPQTVHRYRGRKGALAAFHFAASHPELSRTACLGMLVAKCARDFAAGCARGNRASLHNSRGQAEAIAICLKSMFGSADILAELEDE